MKLMELLEQGKKATREDIEKCLYVDVDRSDIEIFKICDNNKNGYNPSFKDLTRNDWYEYKEYKTNFEFEEGDKYYSETAKGYIYALEYEKLVAEDEAIENFNAFPNKELAEFIQKKQLLERKLMVFSYLNGASEIDWNTNDSKYYVYCYYCNEKVNIEMDYNTLRCEIGNICFKNVEICEKALELYKDEMKEVMEMKIKLGF